MTAMGAFQTFSHIPFDFVSEPSIGRWRESRRVCGTARPARLTGPWVVGAARGRFRKETTHDPDR